MNGAGFDVLDYIGPEAWDDGNSGFMQSRFWARFKSATGWKARVCRPREGFERSGILVLEKPLIAGLRFAYVPFGPETLPEGANAVAFLEDLAKAVSEASGRGLLFVRFDLPWEAGLGTAGKEGRFSGLSRGVPVQVPDTVLLDLEPGEDTILAGMKPKWRYNVKLADKKGVVVSREGRDSLESFYTLYKETAARDGIAIHPFSYYEELFRTFEGFKGSGGRDDLSLWVARQGGETIASIITLFHKGHATYLYGASSGEKRNLMPAYALQWSAIKAAKEEGCIDYDFFGIPPNDDPKDPMAGLYFFKTGFGGRILHRAGAVDIPLRPLPYFEFRILEAIRLAWYKGLKKAFARQRRRPALPQRKTVPSKA
ncbi:MAG: peptidoglycan bridge formation glycyltransferase FemA/FemB family protein [Spirochaetes bacterium]|nr:peptidoglycan bridge formation glycyltransferase FemA/FemB family protein [Spirochaetota bacterium]